MRIRATVFALTLGLVVAASPARAQNREHLQLTADLQMLQELVNRQQLVINQLTELVKVTNKRLDDLSDANTKQFANQKVLQDQALENLGTLRAKLQDGDVRVAQLTQEMTPIRAGIQDVAAKLNTLLALLQAPSVNTSPDGAAPGAAGGNGPLGSVTIQPSAASIYGSAFNDYQAGRFETAIEGFREVIQKYPESPNAAEAQFEIAESLYYQGKFKDAIQEYQQLITNYKTSTHLAEAYFMQGTCYSTLGQKAEAQRKYEAVIKQFPNTSSALMAATRLDAMGVKR